MIPGMGWHPHIEEHDSSSWLEPSLTVHDVLRRDGEFVLADGTPNYDREVINLAPPLCRAHAYDLARSVGFAGPVIAPVAYDSFPHFEPEELMVLADSQIATYSYGRAYFEPGEPRTAPCAVCGKETLADACLEPPG